MPARKLLSCVVALSMALDPFQQAFAAPNYYYRNVAPGGGSSPDGSAVGPGVPGVGGSSQPASTDPVQGTGALSVFGPIQVRARPGIAFSLGYRVGNASGDVTWRSVGSPAPDGLSLNPGTGRIEGTPGGVGSYAGVMVEATDAAGSTGRSPAMRIDVVATPGVAVPATVPAKVASAFSLKPTVTNAYGSQAWSYSGTLPLGVGFDSTTGALSGTPRQSGTFDGITLAVVDSDGARGESAPFSIEVVSAVTINGVQSRYPARLNAAMPVVRPFATGTPGPYAWSLDPASGALPPGISLDAATGIVSGTATADGTSAGLLLAARDVNTGDATVSGKFSIVAAGAPAISVGSLYTHRVGSGFTVQPVATNLLGSGYWRITGNPGVSFDKYSGAISGTSGSVGTISNLTIGVVDLFDGASAASQPITLQTWPVFRIPYSIPIPGAQVGKPFTLTIPALTGLIGTPTYGITGALPPGLTFDKTAGVLSGTPTTAGTYGGLQFTAVDGGDGARDQSGSFTITVVPEGQPVSFAVNPVQDNYDVLVNGKFSLAPGVVGASGPVTWSLSGQAPPWATFDAKTGSLTGTPTQPASYSGLSLTATDSGTGAVASTPGFAITVAPAAPIGVSYAAPAANAGSYYQTFPSVTNAVGDVRYALYVGSLPPGMSFNSSTGGIYGAPSAVVDATGLVVTATDSTNATAYSAPFSITVKPSAASLVATMAAQSSATVGFPFSAKPDVTNSSPPNTWTLTAGTLPAWATLDPASGTISGTPDAVGVSDGLVLQVADAYGRIAGTRAFAITVTTAPTLAVSLPASLQVSLGASAAIQPTVSGAIGTPQWSLIAGTLPAGLTFDTATGRITGTATQIGVADGLLVSVKLSNGSTAATDPFSIAVTASPITIDPVTATQNATYGTRFGLPAPRTTGANGPVTWSLASGTLPGWASLDAATGAISGLPDAIGTSGGLRLRVVDANGSTASTTPFSIATARPPLSAAGPSSRTAVHPGNPIQIPGPTVSGAIGTLSYSLTGTLPDGLTFTPATGAISGQIGVPGAIDGLAVTVRDAFDGAVASTSPFGIDVNGAPVVFVSSAYQAIRGKAFSAAPTVSNAVGSTTWTLASGTLPAWATLDASTGAITGTPADLGQTDGLSLAVSDAGNGTAVSAKFSITVGSGITASLPKSAYRGRVGLAFATDPATPTNVVGSATYGIASGTLPTWATLDPVTGVISGKPDAAYSGLLALSVTDSTKQSGTSTSFSLSVLPSPTVTAASQTLRAGAPLSLVPGVSDAIGSRSWRLAQGTLPAGVAVAADSGTIFGRPTQTGTFDGLAVAVTDSDGATGRSPPFAITVQPGPTLTPPSAPVGGRVGQPLSVPAMAVANAVGAIGWNLLAGAMPAGLSLNADGTITGTPTSSGSFAPVIQATDGFDHATVSAPVPLAISPVMQVLGSGATSIHVGQSFATPALSIVGQRGTPIWTLTKGSLPSWAGIDGGTGTIRGVAPVTPTVVGGLAVTATDQTDKVSAQSAPFDISVLDALAVTNLPTAMTARFGYPFAAALPTGLNVIGRQSWSWAGTPPSWANLNTSTGAIVGTPDSLSGATGLSLVLTDGTGASAPSVQFDLRVYAQPAIRLAQTAYTLRQGDPLTITPQVSGIVGTPTWSIVVQGSGAIPPGLGIDKATGVVSGIADAATSATFVLRVVDGTDGATVDSQPVSLTVSAPFTLSGIKGPYYGRTGAFLKLDQPIPANAGGSVSWSLAGNLPYGITGPDASGVISGVIQAPNGQQTLVLTGTSSFDSRTAAATFLLSTLDQPAISGVRDVTVRNNATIDAASYQSVAANIFGAGKGSWSTVGSASLPNGVGVDPLTGRLTGTPTGYTVATAYPNNVLQVTDTTDSAKAQSDPFKVTVNPALGLDTVQTTLSLRTGMNLSAAKPTVTGLVGTPQWRLTTVSGASIPATVDASGVVTLSPTGPGTWTYALRLTDLADNAQVTGPPVTVTVLPRTTLAYAASTALAPGVAANIPATVANNLGTLTYLVSSGTLPSGLSVDASGAIVGQTSVLGTVYVTIAGMDTDGFVATSNSVRIAVSSGLDVYGGTASPAKVGRPYTQTATATNASGAVTWGYTGTLPAGLTFANGVIQGSPTTVGTSAGIAITAKDSRNVTVTSDTFSITVGPANAITAVQPAKWRVGLSGRMPLSVANGTGSSTWSIASGALPPGLAIGTDGTISGTPTLSGTFTAGVQNLDADGSVSTYQASFTVQSGPALTYGGSRTFIPNDVVNLAPSVQNLIGTPTYAIASGRFPAGINLTSGGTVAGTAGAVSAGVPTVVSVTDSDGAVAMSPAFSVAVSNTGSYIDVPASPAGQVYVPFSLTPQAYLRNQPINTALTWYLTGSRLPQGLSFDSLTGTISGTPLEKGSFVFAFGATYSGQTLASGQITLTVADRPALSAAFPNATVAGRLSTFQSLTPAATNAVGTPRWSIASGALPSGMSLSSLDGTVSGSPTATGPFTFALKVADAYGVATTPSVTLTVAAAITASMTQVSSINRVGVSYLANLYASGTISMVQWTVAGGQLPPGVALNRDTGVLSGTLGVAGSYSAVVRATELATGATATVPVALTVTNAPTILAFGDQTVGVNGTLSFTPSALNVNGTPTWSLSGPPLPAGLSFSATNGAITGSTATATVLSGLVMSVQDADGLTASSRPFTLSVIQSGTLAVTLPANVGVVRGQYLGVVPVTLSNNGTVRYELYDLSSGSSVQIGAPNAASGSYPLSSFSSNYAGLNFSYTTGAISGTPTQTMGALSNGTATATFRVRAVETRTGGAAATSNQMVVTLTDWAAPTISIPTSLSLSRFQSGSLNPIVSGVAAGSTVRYQVAFFSPYYGQWIDYSATSNSNTCQGSGATAASGYVYLDTSAYSNTTGCTGIPWSETNVMTGLTLNMGTGIISGTPTKAMTAAGSSLRQVRVALFETRQGVNIGPVYSNAATISVADQIPSTASLPATWSLTKGTAGTITPSTPAPGTQRWELYDLTSGSSSQVGNPNAASGAYSMGSYNAAYAGLTFNYATGVISGTPTATFTNRALRMYLIETRNGAVLPSVATNQMVLSSIASAPSVTVSYAPADLSATVGQPLSALPQVAGATATSYALSFRKFGASGSPTAGETYPTALPGSLAFDASTGRFSGSVPIGTVSGNASPNALVYRGMQVCINGSTTSCSDEVRIAIGDRSKPSLVVPSTNAVTVNVPFAIQPQPSGIVGTPTYSLAYSYGTYNSSNATGQGDLVVTSAAQKPAWLSLDAATGVLSGTPALNSPTRIRGLQVCVTDGQGYQACSGEVVLQVANRAGYSIAYANPVVSTQINKPFQLAAPVLTGNAVGTVSYALKPRAYSTYAPTATDTVLSAQPSWMTFDATTGAISGTVPPGTLAAGNGNGSTNVSNFRGWNVVATDSQGFTAASQEVQIAVAERVKPTLDAPAFSTAQVNQVFSVTPAVGGEVNGTPTYSLVYGYGTYASSTAISADDHVVLIASQMPTWLGFNASTGVLSGVPPVGSAGRYRGLQICLTDAQGYMGCTGEVVIEVRDKPVFSISSPPLVQATVKQPFSTPALQPTNAVGAVTYALVPRAYTNFSPSGGETVLTAQPSWLTLDPASGAMSGTVPVGSLTGAGPGNGSANATLFRGWRIKATDSQGAIAYSDEFMLQVSDRAKPTLSLPPVTNAQVNVAFTAPPGVSGISGTATYTLNYGYGTYNVSNAAGQGDTVITTTAQKPSWLAFGTANGTFSGTPSVGSAGRYRGLQVCLTDGDGYVACSDEVVITVLDRPALGVTWPGLGDATIGQAYSQQAIPANAAAAMTYTLEFGKYGTPSLPSAGETYPTALPTWLTFNTTTGTLQGTAPTGSAAMMRGMRVKGTDGQMTAYTGEVAIRIH